MRICSVVDCSTKHKARGYCDFHHDRFKKYGDPLAGPPRKRSWPETCSVADCSNRGQALGYCPKHYNRFRKYGDPNVVAWEYGARDKAVWHVAGKAGYIWRYEPANANATANGFVYQHRHVMAQSLGRPLLTGESVHHRNGDRADNRLENLELWVSAQPAGQRPCDLLQYAVEIIERYASHDCR